MKKLFAAFFVVLLTGCLGPAKFDASNDASIKESVQKISASLPEEKREDLKKAITYYSVGGETGINSMMRDAFSGKASSSNVELSIAINLKSIDGLTGDQIIDKYKSDIERQRLKREKEEAERNRLSAIESEARELLKSRKFEEALDKFKSMGEIPSGIESGKKGVEETTKAMESFSEKMRYIDKIEITDFVAKRIDTYLNKNTPAVRISLKNKGDRTLKEVKVIVYFQDKDGKTIFEEDFYPVLVSQYRTSGDNKPLKPGYVREMESGKYFTIESALSEWKEGKASAKIVDIEFADQ